MRITERERYIERERYLKVSAWALCAVLSGFAWYGIVLLAAWALRAAGVNVTGI